MWSLGEGDNAEDFFFKKKARVLFFGLFNMAGLSSKLYLSTETKRLINMFHATQSD